MYINFQFGRGFEKNSQYISVLQDCKPLLLKGPNGSTWEFQGVEGIVKGRIDAAAALCPPDGVGAGTDLCPHNSCQRKPLLCNAHTYLWFAHSARIMSKLLHSCFHMLRKRPKKAARKLKK